MEIVLLLGKDHLWIKVQDGVNSHMILIFPFSVTHPSSVWSQFLWSRQADRPNIRPSIMDSSSFHHLCHRLVNIWQVGHFCHFLSFDVEMKFMLAVPTVPIELALLPQLASQLVTQSSTILLEMAWDASWLLSVITMGTPHLIWLLRLPMLVSQNKMLSKKYMSTTKYQECLPKLWLLYPSPMTTRVRAWSLDHCRGRYPPILHRYHTMPCTLARLDFATC